MNRPIVFLGPSFQRSRAEELIEAEFLPPAERGHIYRAALMRPQIIILIDGAFETTPAVLHREILFALSRGVPIAGAASIGALRAAELEKFGMLGLGEVYESYRDGVLDGDDEVALIHAPYELDYAPLSEPLVTMRATLAAAQDAGLLSEIGRTRGLAHLKQMCFRDRAFDALSSAMLELGSHDRIRLIEWCQAFRVDPKAKDAHRVLNEANLGNLQFSTVVRPFIATTAWINSIEDWNLFIET